MSMTILTPFQSGYRVRHSTTTAVPKVFDYLSGQLDRGYNSALVFPKPSIVSVMIVYVVNLRVFLGPTFATGDRWSL
jgi:hypothetical protein